MGKWIEEILDILLFLGILAGFLLFFLLYWKGSFQLQYAEIEVNEFLTTARVEGKITAERFERLVKKVDEISSSYELDISCREYRTSPIYNKISATALAQYYMKRNTRKQQEKNSGQTWVAEENAEQLKLLQERNDTILAEETEYLPLPSTEEVWEITAVREQQKVYEGEELITLCLIRCEDGISYAEAESAKATSSGTVFLNLKLDGSIYQIPVEVECHPRYVICDYGHQIVNSMDILLEAERTGNISCPYCKSIPESLLANTVFLRRKTGKPLSEEELWVTAFFSDGSSKRIGPQDEGWLDDYDENYNGIQNVTISYHGTETSVQIFSENELCLQCAGSCEGRSYTDYEAFPYCTDCMSQVALFTGEISEEEWVADFQNLLAVLYESGEIALSKGSYLCVSVRQNGKIRSTYQVDILTNGGSESKK